MNNDHITISLPVYRKLLDALDAAGYQYLTADIHNALFDGVAAFVASVRKEKTPDQTDLGEFSTVTGYSDIVAEPIAEPEPCNKTEPKEQRTCAGCLNFHPEDDGNNCYKWGIKTQSDKSACIYYLDPKPLDDITEEPGERTCDNCVHQSHNDGGERICTQIGNDPRDPVVLGQLDVATDCTDYAARSTAEEPEPVNDMYESQRCGNCAFWTEETEFCIYNEYNVGAYAHCPSFERKEQREEQTAEVEEQEPEPVKRATFYGEDRWAVSVEHLTWALIRQGHATHILLQNTCSNDIRTGNAVYLYEKQGHGGCGKFVARFRIRAVETHDKSELTSTEWQDKLGRAYDDINAAIKFSDARVVAIENLEVFEEPVALRAGRTAPRGCNYAHYWIEIEEDWK